MSDKKNSKPFVLLVCILFIVGIICLGLGIGKLIDRVSEGVIISVGLALITVAILLTKYFIRDES